MKIKATILLVVATHGDEKIGLEAVLKLLAKNLGRYFDVLVANPLALDQNKRFLDKDLNRSYPGQRQSLFYEERRAYQNLKTAQKYDYIIDLHEASAGTDDFIIVPRESISNKFPLDLINLKRVLLWPDPAGPLSQILENAIELEFGMKNRNRQFAANKCAKIVEFFITQIYYLVPDIRLPKKEFYCVYDKLVNDKKIKVKPLKDFKLSKLAGEEFYPLLVGQYLRLGIICYKMRKINWRN